MEKILNYVGGEWLEPVSQSYLENIEPATGKAYSLVPDSDERDVEKALEAAHKAFPGWSAMGGEKRSEILLKIASLIEKNLEALARAESVDNGKPLSLARTIDIPRSASNFRFFATALLHTSSSFHSTDQSAINYTLRQPLGVVGCISPWNLPLYLFTWKIAPALAAGNCVVGKPSEITPMTAHLLSKICHESGLPPGVLGLVHGLGSKAGASLVSHRKVKAISFTGGTKTGAEIARIAAPQFKKLSLELGGKNPNIIFSDCSFENMIETTVRSSFTNQGQICLTGSRIFVEASLYKKFRSAFLPRIQALKMGDPLEETTQQGAVVSKAHLEKILYYIDLAKKEGGKILCGGKQIFLPGRCAGGYFVEPTVIEGLSPNSRTCQEEIFGPVVTLVPFESEEEAISYANGVEYGLASIIWTENLSRAHRIAAHLESGIVWINCWMLRDLRTPFGGMKSSGVGREGGWQAMEFFTESKNVCVKISPGENF